MSLSCLFFSGSGHVEKRAIDRATDKMAAAGTKTDDVTDVIDWRSSSITWIKKWRKTKATTTTTKKKKKKKR